MAEPYLTMVEIEAKYPNEWVVVGQLKKGRDGFAVGGVLAHGTDKEAVYGAVDQLPVPHDLALFYTGPIPEDVMSSCERAVRPTRPLGRGSGHRGRSARRTRTPVRGRYRRDAHVDQRPHPLPTRLPRAARSGADRRPHRYW